MFTFSVFDQKYPWVNLVPKFTIVCLKWNLVTRLIQRWRIQWWCSLFLFLTKDFPFLLVNFVQRNKNCHFKLKFGTYTNSNMQNAIVAFSFCSWPATFVQKIHLVFSCYLIKLPVIYLQIFEACGFSCWF